MLRARIEMPKSKHPVTPAIRALRAAGVAFEPRLYRYEERGGTRASSQALGVDERRVIKTLVMQTESKAPLIVLMHGDAEVSTKALARLLGVKTVEPCSPAVAQRLTGYQVGGTSPFGTRTQIPTYGESTIAELETVCINGGKRGFLVEMSAADVFVVAKAQPVSVAAG